MSEAKIVRRQPAITTLNAGTRYWYSCGRSAIQLFCDGSHQGTEFTPLVVKVKATTEAASCQCQHTSTPPCCDGSHNQL